MAELKVVNYIYIDGQELLWDDLPEEKRRELAEIIQVRMMEAAGFRRRTTA